MVEVGETRTASQSDEQLAEELQSQINELWEKLANLSASFDSEKESTANRFKLNSESIGNITAGIELINLEIADIADGIEQMKQDMADEITTEKLNAVLAEIKTLNSQDINTKNCDTETLEAVSAVIDKVKAEILEVETFTLENLEADSVKSDSVETDSIETENLTADSGTIEELTAERIKSGKVYHSQSYDVPGDVEKYTVRLNQSFLMCSNDPDDKWSVSFNGEISYTNPNLTLRRIEFSNDDDGDYAVLYFYHPGNDLSFTLLSFGEDLPELSFEVVHISDAYDEENAAHRLGGMSASLASEKLSVRLVDGLPREAEANTIYIVDRKGAFYFDGDRYAPLNILNLDFQFEGEDPIRAEYKAETSTLEMSVDYEDDENSDLDLSFVRV